MILRTNKSTFGQPAKNGSSSTQPLLEYPYYRAVFKQPDGDYLTREDAEPVYEKER